MKCYKVNVTYEFVVGEEDDVTHWAETKEGIAEQVVCECYDCVNYTFTEITQAEYDKEQG